MTADLFPSYILEPKKIIEDITWFLNPIEEPPQKFLQLLTKNSKTTIYSDLLRKDGFIVKSLTEPKQLLSSEFSSEDILQESWFNIVFSLANETLFENFEEISSKISHLLRPSSYFIYEVKITENLDRIKEILLQSFESVNFLTPWSLMNTNPFTPFDQKQNKYCWVVALSQGSDEDPADWLNNL